MCSVGSYIALLSRSLLSCSRWQGFRCYVMLLAEAATTNQQELIILANDPANSIQCSRHNTIITRIAEEIRKLGDLELLRPREVAYMEINIGKSNGLDARLIRACQDVRRPRTSRLSKHLITGEGFSSVSRVGQIGTLGGAAA